MLEEGLKKYIDLLVKHSPALESCSKKIIAAYLIIEECYENGGKLLDRR